MLLYVYRHIQRQGEKTDGARKREKPHKVHVQSHTSTAKNKTWDVIVVTEVGPQTTAAYLLNSGETTFFHFPPLYCFFLSRQETISQVNNSVFLLNCSAEASLWMPIGTRADVSNLS